MSDYDAVGRWHREFNALNAAHDMNTIDVTTAVEGQTLHPDILAALRGMIVRGLMHDVEGAINWREYLREHGYL